MKNIWKNTGRALLASGLFSRVAAGGTCVNSKFEIHEDRRNIKALEQRKYKLHRAHELFTIDEPGQQKDTGKTQVYENIQKYINEDLDNLATQIRDIETNPQFIAEEGAQAREAFAIMGQSLGYFILATGLLYGSYKAYSKHFNIEDEQLRQRFS